MSAPVYVLAAGGTGGHMFPAEALAGELRRRGARVVLFTDERGKRFAKGFAVEEIVVTDSATLSGGAVARLRAGVKLVNGVAQAARLLARVRPKAVVGFGGYPSAPAMSAALVLRIPTVIHDSNALLGRTNRLLEPLVTRTALGLPSPEGRGPEAKAVLVGNPVREGVRARAGAPYEAPRPGGELRLLVFGGSQGARIFGEVVPEAVGLLAPELRARLRLVQQVREEDMERVRGIYERLAVGAELAPFFDDMPDRLAAAHLVLARAGAGSVTELMAIGRPAILVPFAGAMDDHQTVNARVLADAGAGFLLAEAAFTPGELAGRLADLAAAPERLAGAAEAARGLGQTDATERLANLVEEASRASGSATQARRAS
ncbi:MAG: undecaprenyldiphospho-muramoylpentapeptide beta-N-acetylglucosaminyltransferase [Alphaproteobacteria bacterium]|nr:undecaprenyldiphospho-muramoylpentapeptide beta-N-acetylglucosaminyltransferase [Alphaproteobacteria bacterium]